jgi:hypothetical protein
MEFLFAPPTFMAKVRHCVGGHILVRESSRHENGAKLSGATFVFIFFAEAETDTETLKINMKI